MWCPADNIVWSLAYHHHNWDPFTHKTDIQEGPGISLSLVKLGEKCQVCHVFDRVAVKKFHQFRKISCHGRDQAGLGQLTDCVQL